MKKILNIFRYLGLYFVALVLLSFGFAKIVGDQFVLTNYIEYVPLKYVDDYSLAWAFFNRSFVYNFIIGLLELSAGSLILFRKTRLIGLLMAFGIYVNIVLVDVLFKVNDAIIHATLELLIIILLLIPYFKSIKRFLWDMGGRFKQKSYERSMNFSRFIPPAFIIVVIFLNIWLHQTTILFDEINGAYRIEITQNDQKINLERGPWTEEAVVVFDFDKSFNIMSNHKNHWGNYRIEKDSVFLAFQNEFLSMKSLKGVFLKDKITGTDDNGYPVIFELQRIPETQR